MVKRRINITMDEKIHEKSKYWVSREQKNLSELIEEYLQKYIEDKQGVEIQEPMVSYGTETVSHSLNALMSKLPYSKQEQVVQFAQFLSEQSKKELKVPVFGVISEGIWMSEDFDEPLSDFKEYMP